MTRNQIVVLLGVLASGCKGETVYKDKAETVQALDNANKAVEEKNKLIAALQAENARCQQGGSGGGEIVVAIEGNLMTVKSNGTGGGTMPKIDDKLAAAGATEFQNLVQKSRGAIQKCYEQALKKNSAIQGRTITLSVSASFTDSGAYKSSNFSAPVNLGDVFDTCIKAVAAKWQLTSKSPASTFKATVSLTPS